MKEAWIARMFFASDNDLYEEHKNQGTAGGYKSHLCFLIIAKWKTNICWFGSLFIFPIEWHQTGKQMTTCTEDVVFLLFPIFMLRMKKEAGYFYLPFSFFELGNAKWKLDYPLSNSIMGSEYEKRNDGIYNKWCSAVFPFLILLKKITKMCIKDHISIFRLLFVDLAKWKGYVVTVSIMK